MERGTQTLFFSQPRNELIPFVVGIILVAVAVGEGTYRAQGIQL